MKLNLNFLLIITCVIMCNSSVYSQFGFSHEVGIIAGPVAFQSDFGERHDLSTNEGNTGIGIGLIHYINFSYKADCNCYTADTYFNDHFKLRNELSWNRTKLNHFGEWVQPYRQTIEANQLRAHTGVANNINIGTQLEYFPYSVRAFTASINSFAPFVSLGAQFTSYNPKVHTSYGDGDITNPNNFYSYWAPGSVSQTSGTTWSVVGSVGTRYKLSVLSDLMVDLRWQYFFSNWVDGLNHQLPSNKVNDWLVWFNFGYIYYLD